MVPALISRAKLAPSVSSNMSAVLVELSSLVSWLYLAVVVGAAAAVVGGAFIQGRSGWGLV